MRWDSLNVRDALDATKSLRTDRDRGVALVRHGNVCCAAARKAAGGASLARVWLLARLPFTRADRMGTGAEPRASLLVWWPGLLSRALERRWVRPMLDSDADRECMELRPIARRDPTGQCIAQPTAKKRPQRGTRRGRVVSQSFADRDAADSPTVARHDALPNRIANACVAVVGIISAVIRIKAQAQTKPNSRASKTTATAETATATTATTASTTATGKGRCAGRSQ
jgi:hypothetical protein